MLPEWTSSPSLRRDMRRRYTILSRQLLSLLYKLIFVIGSHGSLGYRGFPLRERCGQDAHWDRQAHCKSSFYSLSKKFLALIYACSYRPSTISMPSGPTSSKTRPMVSLLEDGCCKPTPHSARLSPNALALMSGPPTWSCSLASVSLLMMLICTRTSLLLSVWTRYEHYFSNCHVILF